MFPAFRRTSPHENLRGAASASELNDAIGHHVALNHADLDAQIARKSQMLFDRLPLLLRKMGKGGIRADVNGEAFGPEVVGYSPASPDQHRSRGPLVNTNEDALLSAGRLG